MRTFFSHGWRHVGGWVLMLALCGQAWANERVFRYGVYENPPKVYTQPDGQPAGIFVDLMNALAQAQGWQLEPVRCEWSQCLQMLETGQLDWMPDVAITADRALRFDFHAEPVLHSWSQMYARPDNKLDSMLSLHDKTVTVLRGSVQEAYLQELKLGLGIDLRIQEVSSMEEGFRLVQNEHADAVLTNRHYGDIHASTFDLVATPIILQPAALFIAVRKALNFQPELNAIDRQLKAWKADSRSVYFDILRKWSGDSGPQRLSPVMVWSMAGVLAALLISVAIGLLLKRQVRRVTADLRNSRDELNTILDSVGAHIYIKDTALRYVYANKQTQELWGLPLSAIKGKTDEAFFDPQTAATLNDNDRWVLDNGERLVTEERNTLQEGGPEQVFLSVKIPLRNAAGQTYGLCGISTDLTGNLPARDQIQALAYYDALTHLPNRRLLMDRLSHGLAVHQRNHRNGALIVLNLDGFSLVNNTLGHAVGDRLLRLIAERLMACVRSEDTVSRASGDEFVVLLNDLSTDRDEAAEQTQVVIQKIRQNLEQQNFPVNNHQQSVSACIGVAFFTDVKTDADEIFRLADLALHQAKAEGPGSIRFFNQTMQMRANSRALMETDLRLALARGEFFLEYQPQVAHNGHVLGVEALLRWRHPEKGLIPPGEFIGIAESTSLILPLGRWVMEQACALIAQWSQHPDLSWWTVAVNVSSRQFQQPHFVDDVLGLIEQSGISPDRLELELTESVLVRDIEEVEAKMRQLSQRGVRLSIDDFGTGYSSLNYLKRLPLSKVKIDKSFIDELQTNTQSRAIVKSIISLADNLGMGVIAEGVEHQGQVEALKAMGPVEYQGYWFAKPMPPQALPIWLGQHRQRPPSSATA